jgi:hypothetical protein
MAGNRDLPPLFAALLPGPKVAWAPLLLAGAVAAVLSASISVPALLAASAFTALFGWTVANAEALLAARGDALRLVLHGASLLACAGLALSLPGGAIRSGLVLVFAGVIVYLLRPFWK